MDSPNDTSMELNDTVSETCSEDTPVFCLARTVSISLTLGIISIVTVVGNIFVMLAYFRDYRIRSSVANTFILNLSFSDLIVGAVSIPLNSIWIVVGHWPFGKTLCQIWLIVDYTATNVAVITIIFISLDRYWLLTKKLAYYSFQTHKRAATMNAVSWITHALFYTSVTFAWAPLAGVENINYDEECELEPYDNLLFLAVQITVEFLIPLNIIIIMNAMVYINIKQRSISLFRKPEQSREILAATSASGRGGRNNSKRNSLEATPDDQRLSVGYNKARLENLNQPSIGGAYSNVGFNEQLESITIHLGTSLPPSHHIKTTDSVGDNTNKETKDIKTAQQGNGPNRDHRAKCKEFKRHRKAAITLSVLVGVFIATWLSFYVVSLLSAFCEDCVSDLAWEVVNYLLWCNSTVNPFLYALMVVRFRQHFLRYMGLQSCTKRS